MSRYSANKFTINKFIASNLTTSNLTVKSLGINSTMLMGSVTTLLAQCWIRLTRQLGRSLGLGAIALLFSLSILGSCARPPATPIRVATNLWPGYETFHLANNLGYYKNTPIEFVDFPSGTEEVRAYRNGNVEAAGISLDQALVLATTNPDLRIVTIVDFSEGGDVILAKPTIATVKALKGKRVGVEANALGAYIITRALEQAGLTPKDIQIVSLGLSEHERAFKAGDVDAVVTFGPARANLLSAGAKELFNSAQIPGEIVDVLIVRDSVIAKQPDAVKALVKGQFQAIEYLAKNPQDAAARIAPRTGITPAQFLDAEKGLKRPNLAQNRELLGKSDRSLLPTIQRLVEVMVTNKLLPKAIDPAPLLDDRIVNQVQL